MISACTTAPLSPSSGEPSPSPSASPAAEVMGPFESPAEPTQGPPDPTTVRATTVILGPGMAHSLAAVGVLQAMHERGQRVGAVVGLEMGSVVAALYGATASLSSLEWDLMKLRLADTFSERSWMGNLLKLGSRKEEFHKNFEKVRSHLAFESMRVPVVMLVRNSAGVYAWVPSSGEVSPALDQAIFTDAGKVDTRAILSMVQAKFSEPRVWVGFAPPAEGASAGDLWIEADLKGIEKTDFRRQNEIVFRGKKAALRALASGGQP
jgi:predicted acylesterase/phospholipase RssA